MSHYKINNKSSLVTIIFWSICITFYFNHAIAADSAEGRIEVPSSFNPVGSGARALGLGGAFIAIADDATAASWNPAALIQLRTPEMSIVGAAFERAEDNTFGTNPEANGVDTVSNGNLNYLSASYPCGEETCGRNMVFSINYQNLYNFDKDWDFPIHGSSQVTVDTHYDIKQTGDLSALGLAYAVRATDTLSLGVTLNLWGDYLGSNEWNQSYIRNSELTLGGFSSVQNEIRNENYQFNGVNANLGLFWDFYQQEEEKLTLGLVVKTAFTADIKHTTKSLLTRINNGVPIEQAPPNSISSNEQLDMPLSYGMGIAYQYSDALTLSGDLYRTSWDKFIRTDENGNKSSAISNLPIGISDVAPTYQARFGMEYRIISQEFGANYIIPLRAGIFYDPAPAEGSPDNFYGFSLGTGIAYETYVFDIAYQYRFGHDVGQYTLPAQEFSQDVSEHTVYGSMMVRF